MAPATNTSATTNHQVSLIRPIVVRGCNITELKLRKVTARDVHSLGMPMLIFDAGNGLTGMEFRPKVLFDYIARLSGLPLATVKDMAMADLAMCHKHIMSFFE